MISQIRQYQGRVHTVDAVQYRPGENTELKEWLAKHRVTVLSIEPWSMTIYAAHRSFRVMNDDYIVRDDGGDLHVLSPEAFNRAFCLTMKEIARDSDMWELPADTVVGVDMAHGEDKSV